MSSSEIPPFLDPIIQSIADSFRLPLAFIVVNVAFTSIMIPMLIALFYFANNRTSPVFICALTTVLFAILQGATIVGNTIRGVLHPLAATSIGSVVTDSIVVVLSFLSVDILLMCRVLTVVPPSRTSPFMLIAVYTFPVLSKLARITLLVIYCVHYAQDARRGPFMGSEFDSSSTTVRITESIWFITAADSAYASAIFLWRLRASAFKSRQNLGLVTDGRKGSLRSRVRTLFWLCGTNFIFPVPLYVAQLVFLKINSQSPVYEILTFFNNYVSAICAVFATIWSTGISRSQPSINDDPDGKASSLYFQRYDAQADTRQMRIAAEMELVPTTKQSIGSSSTIEAELPAKRPDAAHLHMAWSWESDV